MKLEPSLLQFQSQSWMQLEIHYLRHWIQANQLPEQL
jgi:hypothetical protein